MKRAELVTSQNWTTPLGTPENDNSSESKIPDYDAVDTGAAPSRPASSYLPDLYHHVFELVGKKIAIEHVDPQTISRDLKYRFDTRSYRGTDAEVELKDLEAHIEKLSILNPILVLECREIRFVVSGLKRLDASRDKGHTTIPCKVLKFDQAFPEPMTKLDERLKEELLAEVLKAIVYVEAAHTTKIDDASTLTMLRTIAKNSQLKASDFDKVMWIVGITRKSPQYRSLHRLWKIAANDIAYKLIDDKVVRVRVLKRDQNIRPLYVPFKAVTIDRNIRAHAVRWLQRADKDDQEKRPTEISDYKDADVEQIIREVDYHNTVPFVRQTDDLRQIPRYDVNTANGTLSIPDVKLDLRSADPKDFRKAVDVYFRLRQAVWILRNYLDMRKPEVVGGPLQESKMLPPLIKLGESYYNFITENNLHAFADIAEIDRYLWERGGRQLGKGKRKVSPLRKDNDPELKALKRNRDKAKLLMDRFLKQAQAEAEERRKAEAEAQRAERAAEDKVFADDTKAS